MASREVVAVKPSQCNNCRRYFMASLTLQAEMRHHAAIYGARSAESELNERLEDLHLAHKPKRAKT